MADLLLTAFHFVVIASRSEVFTYAPSLPLYTDLRRRLFVNSVAFAQNPFVGNCKMNASKDHFSGEVFAFASARGERSGTQIWEVPP